MLASRLPVQTEAHRSQDRSRLTIQPGTVYPACLPIRPIQVLHAFDPISCSARLSASESLIVTIHWAFQPFGVAGRRQRISAIYAERGQQLDCCAAELLVYGRHDCYW